MKLSLSFLSLIALTLTTQAQAQTQRPLGTAGTNYNPFSQGTVKVVLTTEEKADLLTYADNSKARLVKAKEQAAGKSFDEANQIYTRAIIDVVMDSFRQKARSELLMRFALNEALELTTGIPTADGRAVSQEGLLKHISNQDLLTVILEQSIDLALSFYTQDRSAIKSGSLTKLPYASFANAKLGVSRVWLSAVIESKYQYILSIKILEHFTATASNSDQSERAKYAEEMLLADQTLKSMQTEPASAEERSSRVRKLRLVLRKLNEGLAQKISAQASENLIAGIQNYSVRTNEIRNFTENELRFPGTNLKFSLVAPGNETSSSPDGICKIFGYEKALPGSTKYEHSSSGLDLVIGTDGLPLSSKVYFHTTAITCMNETHQQLVKGVHQFNPSELYYPGTKSQLSLVESGNEHTSNANGICMLLGYQAALKGSTTFDGATFGPTLVINSRGESTGGVDYFSTTSITCIKLN